MQIWSIKKNKNNNKKIKLWIKKENLGGSLDAKRAASVSVEIVPI